ncbi:glycerol ethanol, ferric requiring protein [Neophaeococcomyces mojaviensis]|uniref:Glycerol ethanol, ferric requiring protein n=1 Tax=Neophaeococcomyces mojaviensis TaxID=3383035 RepID=A0ACC2ZQX3_9EURO|nr:glycerol ethanol, ferric requiring protein [Knufia sp. JES_112]
MNRQSSTSSARPQARSSISARRVSRRFSTLSGLEDGNNADPPPADSAITEELAQIKRYEDFTTIDWVQDAAREQTRRRTRRKDAAPFFQRDGTWAWRRKLWESYDAAQAWVVVTLVAIIIGLIAAALNIVTEYLSDLKMGYCTTAWYLNEDFCCYGAESGCDEWRRWTAYGFANYLIYTIMAILLAATASYLVKIYAPYAAGSGISEIKCIIGGFVMKGFLGFWTLIIKAICLPLAIASGLSVGKEGPSVHYATCVGNVVSRFFEKYKQSASKTREILTASSGTGVAVAFGSPIGGVLFSLEEMSSHFPLKTLWRSYFCALVATAVLAAMNPFRTGQLVMFSVKYDRDWHFFEIVFYIILGIFGGVYGAVMIKGHLAVQSFRKKYLAKYAILEAVILAGVTALFCYPNLFLRVDMTEMMQILFRECEGDYDYHGLCEPENRLSNVLSLLVATLLRCAFVALSYGCKVPAGIFVPSMAIGASFGRMIGILVEWLHASFPNSTFFSACQPDVPCITPGTYAFLGAGAALSGIMHLTISVTVIMFELTGALTYILPSMIVIGVTKAVGDRLSKAGIADIMIQFNGYPFLDSKEEHNFGVPASQVMTSSASLKTLPATGLEVKAAQKLLDDTTYSGFPIVEEPNSSKILIGYIGRVELAYALTKARQQGLLAPDAKISFIKLNADDTESPTTPSVAVRTTFDSMARQLVDLSAYIDSAPITVHPRLPLETAMELFKKMGPRVILVEHHGRLEGLMTIKDCLRYQARIEAMEHSSHVSVASGVTEGRQDFVWDSMRIIGEWIVDKVNGLSKGRLRLSPRVNRTGDNIGEWTRVSEREPGPENEYLHENEILDGTEEFTEHEDQARHQRRGTDNVEMDVR